MSLLSDKLTPLEWKLLILNTAVGLEASLKLQVRTSGSSDPVALPKSEPRIVSIHLVVPLVRSIKVTQLQGSGVGEGIELLQPFNFGNGPLKVHTC